MKLFFFVLALVWGVVAGRAGEDAEPRQEKEFYGTLTGTVVEADAERVVLKVTGVYAYTPLDKPAALIGRTVTVPATPETFEGEEKEARNLRGTVARRDQARAYFASLPPGRVIELGVYQIEGDTARLARLPGPTTLAPGAELPPYFGARVDEAAVTTTLHVSATQGRDEADGGSPERAVATLERGLALAQARLDAGEGVRLRVAPGVYRPARTLELIGLSEAARQATFILEGTAPEGVFIRGSVTEGYEPATWTLVDAEKRIYRHVWTPNFGLRSRGYYKPKSVLLHRRELLALNGRVLEPVLLENLEWIDPSGAKFDEEIGLQLAAGGKVEGRTGYIAKGWRDPLAVLLPGQFGVAETGPGEAGYDPERHPWPDTLLLRLPEDVATLDEALIEVGLRETLLRVRDKSNFVLRNLTFEHSAAFYNDYDEKAAIDTNAWDSFSASRDWLWDNVTVRNNRSSGVMLWWVRNATLRDCKFVENGHLGIRPSFVNELVMENCRVDGNNVRGRQVGYVMHTVGGLDFTGQNCVFRRTTFNDNYGCGFRSDYGLEDVLFEDCEVARNARTGGVFHEIEFGPARWRNSRIVGNTGKRGLGLLNVNRVTLEGCTLADNAGGQLELYVSPSRRRAGEMWPLGWFKIRTHYAGTAENHEVPRPDIRELRLVGNTFAATGENRLIGRFFKEGDAVRYRQLIGSADFTSDQNTFWNADEPRGFEVGDRYDAREFTDLAGWQKLTGEDARSVWKNPEPVFARP